MLRLLLPICFLLLANCDKKEVLLPVIPVDGIDQIENHSSLWVFYKISGPDTLAVLNKNNKLINTNWIFNVDRRLRMKDVIPHLQAMQENRNKDSMHKKEGMKNFFSYADSKNNRLSLVDFPQLEFVPIPESMVKGPVASDSICVIDITILDEKFQVDDTSFPFDQVDQITEKLSACDSTRQGFVRLKYSANLTFQNYLAARAHLASENLPVDQKELIHNLK